MLTTVGCRTGQVRRNPVVLVDLDERRWLVAPYGAVSWVHNARAAGTVEITRCRAPRTYAVREVAGRRGRAGAQALRPSRLGDPAVFPH